MSDKRPAQPNTSPLTRRRLLRQMRNGVAAPLMLPKLLLPQALSPVPTLKPGVLRIGTYFGNPPFAFLSHGERAGFELDLMNEVAQRLGLEADFVDTRWEDILREMEEQRYDCIVGGITITPARLRSLAWSFPYIITTLSLLIDTRRSPANMTLADLKGGTVGVQALTTDYEAATAMERDGTIGKVKVYSFAQFTGAIADLTAGRIQAVMKVYPVAAWFVRHTPGLRILEQVPNDPQPLGIGFYKTSTTLVTAVDRSLRRIEEDGNYRAMVERWGLV
jgi:ABC-type amino acid transport substrate-binding protein